jgi:ATP-binding cassette, subfamily B, bacterial
MTSAGHVLRPYIRSQWRAVTGAGLSAVVLALTDLARPWPLKLVIDYIVLGHQSQFTVGSSELLILAGIAGFVLAIAVVAAVAENLSNLWLQQAGERISHDMRVSLYDHLQRLSLGFHERRQKGDLVTRVTGDANAVGDLFSSSLGNVVQASVLLLGMLTVTIILDPVLALVWLAVVPFLAVVAFGFRRRIKAAARRQRSEEGAIASVANEALSAMAVVKAFGSESFERQRVHERSERRMHIGIETSRLQVRFNNLIGILSAFGTASVIVLGVFRVAAGAITPGDLVVFVSYAKKADSPLRHLARESVKIASSMARVERIAEILTADEMLREAPNAYDGGRAAGEIVFERTSFGYGAERPALEDVSLRIPAGSRVAVIGPSGAGKSTLGALIARLYDPTAGRVLIDGRDVSACSHAWLRRQVGVLLQDTVLFTGSVEENIRYGSQASSDAVVEAAKVAVADDFLSRLPDAYGTPLGPQGVGLSGGQRQRIGIARTLLRDPPILLLDEPTRGLDAEAEAELVVGLERLMRGRTTIVITHSLDLARAADRVVVLDAGRIVAEGPPDEILSDGIRRPADGGSRPPVPVDPALPQLNRLLETDAMLPVLERSLGRDTAVEELRVARVLYKPRRRVVVHFRARVDSDTHDAVVRASANGDLAAELKRDVDAARKLDGRSPATTPVVYASEVDAVVTWLPLDAALPALLEPTERLRDRLRGAGVNVQDDCAEQRLLGYKPGARAVLRFGDHVLKAYGKDDQLRRALSGLVASSAVPSVRTARYEACLSELRLTVQSAVDGVVPETAVEAAEEAGALAGRLREARAGRLVEVMPESLLDAAARRATFISVIVPQLESRLETLVTRLRETTPTGEPLVPTHGDFHVDQLLRVGGDLVVIDFDGMCLASPALDLATYLADVVRGRDGDLAALEAVRTPLLAGYGATPAALDWYLATVILSRSPHPFQRFVPGWPGRVEGTIAAAEAVLAG